MSGTCLRGTFVVLDTFYSLLCDIPVAELVLMLVDPIFSREQCSLENIAQFGWVGNYWSSPDTTLAP